ncbi:hydrogen gas-evolving membrane-bound hydrogenase subunit E [Clostridium cochlearium]|jgi:multicomponent Na+:H+ antiporter subunit B|uniref:MnhB protein n=1 Tax=Clostridium cochlearium TaxID=1494 RepID=A0A240A0B8_CLOCO|nr:hydrogen gas-evolving membrane-bound hydrogenase subunit E [Clostridium cochlearium]MBV1821512.1 hypothetical protein [Bacteroidales bacterium MSK.15.36]NSJ92598.1 hypothetical protein [Coprococcus sp. MSK.21.13]MBE6064393.1 hypothetical protein [Clostridium cochlearium]MBU5268839.1 hypothetical protein [Clostridium cochlearium]MCG4570911.1 hypothetical protein [Clostridium cochlearium]
MRKLVAGIISVALIGILLLGVKDLPEFGKGQPPTHGKVSKYYIENSIKETGATNIVTGVILDYRAFDTFVEASVLFTSVVAVMAVLKKDVEH